MHHLDQHFVIIILAPLIFDFLQPSCSTNDAYLEQNVYDENVEHIFEWVDDTVEHSLEFWHSLDGLERSENTQHPKGLDGAQVLTSGAPPVDIRVKQ